MIIDEFIIYPIYPLIFGFVMFGLILFSFFSKKDDKRNIANLALSCINLVVMVVFQAIYKVAIKNNETGKLFYLFFLILSFIFILYFIFFYIIVLSVIRIRNNLFINSISNSPWNSYILLSKNDKIKKISDNLLQQLGVRDKKEVLGKKIFDFLFQKIRITRINETPCDNKRFYERYLEHKKRTTRGDFNSYEIGFYNTNGEEVFFQLSDQPLYYTTGYYGRVINGQIKSGFDMLKLEKKYETVSKDLEILNEKFISVLEVSKDGLCFSDVSEQTMWLSDNLKCMFAFTDNYISNKSFYKLMNEEDFQNYNQVLANITPDEPNFNVKYRLFAKGNYQWFQENGKKIFTPKNIMIVSSIFPINQKHMQQSNIHELDELKDENDMIVKLAKLINEQVYFQLAYIKITNIKEINEKHSRSVGNMILAQYVKKISDAFVDEESELFRLSGTRFGLILTDSKKMGILKEGLKRSDTYLNLVANYGAVQVEAKAYCGIATVKIDSNNAQELAKMAHTALKFSLVPQYNSHICYYSDIK